MAKATVTNNGYSIESLYKWDTGQVLEIYGMTLGVVPQVHFAHKDDKYAIVRQATMDASGVIRASIPDSLLQSSARLCAYVCTMQGDEFKTHCKIVIPVISRAKPNDYAPDEENYVYALNNVDMEILTLEPGEDAKVEKVLDGDNLVLRFSIPRAPTVEEVQEGVIRETLDEVETAKTAAEAAAEVAKQAAAEAAASGGGSGVYETASGENITLTDSEDAPLKGLRLFGKTRQGLPEGNLFDGELEWGWIDDVTGEPMDSTTSVRTTNFIPVMGGHTIVIVKYDGTGVDLLLEYDKDKNFIGYCEDRTHGEEEDTYALRSETRYIKFFYDFMEEITDATVTSVQYTVVYAEGESADPTEDDPIYPESVGDDMGFMVHINEQSLYADLTLRGIPDDTDGNYTDANGQKWYCDEIDFARGVYVQRVQEMVLDGTQEHSDLGLGAMDTIPYRAPGIMVQPETEVAKVFCSHFIPQTLAEANDWHEVGICVSAETDGEHGAIGIPIGDGGSWLREQYAAGTPVTVWYRLAEPIETPLAALKIAAFKAMRTAYPTTTITNDDPLGAGMEVRYAMDTKAYIDKQIAAMKSEVWTFTLADGSTVDKEVVLK